MWAAKISRVGLGPNVGGDAVGDVSLPSGRILELLHPLVCRKVCPSHMDGTVSCASSGIAKDNRIAAKRYISVVDMMLAVCLPLYLARYPTAAAETKLGKPMLCLVKCFGAVIHMLPSLLNVNTMTGEIC